MRYELLKEKELKAELKTGKYSDEEVSLCNAILLLALVRFVCILTPTSFSLFILQDAAILRLYREDDSWGAYVRISKILKRSEASVRMRYKLLKEKELKAELKTGTFTPA
jgi:hypothetical protein